MRLIRLAADRGDAEAQGALGAVYFRGVVGPKDYAEAARWYRKAADQGDSIAQMQIGFAYFFGQGVPKNRAEAARWFRLAARQGQVNAMEALEAMLRRGQLR